ncbi:MAG: T9SS type A sorting domain-containing protein [Candidatus Delongbacteria bacterium]
MSMNRTALLLCLSLLSLLALAPTPAAAQEPAYGSGIVVDGNPGEWDLDDDFFSHMYNGGRNTPSWPGYAILSTLYLRYDCDAQLLYALVLDVENDGELVNVSAGDAWLKLYNVGLPGSKLIDGNGDGGTTPRAFRWVRTMPSDPNSLVIGYEAVAQLDEASYASFEAHLKIGGATSSTGKHAQGNAIPLVLNCEAEPPTVGAVEQPVDLSLSPAHPNPFNPATSLTVTLERTGPASLRVYDMAGRQVASLFDGLRAAGPQSVLFRADGLPSGVYFAVLTSEQGVTSQKLLLLK